MPGGNLWLGPMALCLSLSCSRSDTSVTTADSAPSPSSTIAQVARPTDPDAGNAGTFVSPTDATDTTAAPSSDASSLNTDTYRACLQPHAGRFARCRKETSTSEAAFAQCVKAHANDPKTPDRFRFDDSAWTSFSPTRWRCVPFPAAGSVRVAIESLGSTVVRALPDCATRTVDITESTYGGAIATRCSRRNGTSDELVGRDR